MKTTAKILFPSLLPITRPYSRTGQCIREVLRCIRIRIHEPKNMATAILPRSRTTSGDNRTGKCVRRVFRKLSAPVLRKPMQIDLHRANAIVVS